MTKKRETQEQKIKRLLDDALKDAGNYEVSNCNFVGVKFDEAAVDAVQTIAEALLENAKSLGQLSYVLKASNVTVETMLKIGK